MKKLIILSLIVAASTLSISRAQQVADPNFSTEVDRPGYKKKGPKVLFDEAHNNFHTAGGRYKPFADLITSDGYEVTPNKEKFSATTLKGFKILVISNALGAAQMNMPGAANPAFTAEECDAVGDWVKNGGALLLIADHAPMGGANQILGERFGIDMSKQYTADEQNFEKEPKTQDSSYTRGKVAGSRITQSRAVETPPNVSTKSSRLLANLSKDPLTVSLL